MSGNPVCDIIKQKMSGEKMIIGFIIWSIVTILFICIGISSRKSKEAVGFFSGCKPPVIKDIKRYNNAVSRLWFVSAGIFEIIGIPLLLLEQNSLWFIPCILLVVIGVILMAVVYLGIETKYKEKEEDSNGRRNESKNSEQ